MLIQAIFPNDSSCMIFYYNQDGKALLSYISVLCHECVPYRDVLMMLIL